MSTSPSPAGRHHETRVLDVPGISCDHCKSAIESSVAEVAGVQRVVVDVEARTVTVEGGEDAAIIAAIDDAGYDVA
jgi:copper ion binding protein